MNKWPITKEQAREIELNDMYEDIMSLYAAATTDEERAEAIRMGAIRKRLLMD